MPLVFQQVAQQVELLLGQLHRLVLHGDLMLVHIHGQGAGGEQGLLRGGGPLPQGGPDPGQQLLDGEGLCDIVVRP